MSRQEPRQDTTPIRVNFMADRKLHAEFREVVEREERTVSHALRLYMKQRVEQERDAA